MNPRTAVLVFVFVLVFVALAPACGDDASPCANVDCAHHGNCLEVSGAAVCTCDDGWYDDGPTCLESPVCDAVNCAHGACSVDRDLLTCACDGDWVGAACDTCDTGYVPSGDVCITEAEAQCGDPDAFEWRDAVMYFAMVDRFFDSDGLVDPVEGATGYDGFGSSGQYEGGDLAGVTAKMGYLADLGVTALWITAPFDNRNTRGRGTNDPRWYSAYHGYWPSPADIDYSDPANPDPRPKVDDRIGSEADLTALVAGAHGAQSADGHGIKVLFDYVMNHVDDESGLYAAHPDWFTRDDNGTIVLCAPKNLWDDPYWGTRCAFATYLPAFDFYQDAPLAWSIADVVWWAKTFGIDGYRLDAIKHVPESWLTSVRTELDAAFPAPAGGRFYLVGETFNYDRRDFIKSFIDPDTKLDGQFDFPLEKRLCDGVFGTAGLKTLSDWMDTNDGFYEVDGASKRTVMTAWLGNHDVPRAIHFASGQITDCARGSDAGNGWTDQYPQPTATEPYERLGLEFAVLLTNPGVPLIYYGDEIGLAGGGDPDNRRMMVWNDDDLIPAQLALRANVRALARARGANKALSRGVRTTLSVDASTWVYRLGGCGDLAPDVIVALNRGDVPVAVTLPAGAYTDLVAEAPATGGDLTLAPRSFRLFRAE